MSSYICLVDEDQHDKVLSILDSSLNAVHREPEIVKWLIEHIFNYNRDLEPLFAYLNKNATKNAYHLI